VVAGADVVMADNRFPDFVRPILETAKRGGIPTVLDGDRATAPDDSLFALASHVIFSSEALRATTRLTDLAAALAVMAKRVRGFLAVTNGPDGVLWLQDERAQHMAAFPIEAVDSLGAGDTFHGAFALALAEGRDPVTAMRFAAAAAALKCTRFGGISGTPARAEVEALLAQSRA
jgi:sugar/nucleoside kinase (ribokinase family)